MADRLSAEGYSKLTPDQLNEEFRRLYQALPFDIFPDISTTRGVLQPTGDELLETYALAGRAIDRRSRSELKGILMKRLSQLLEYSQGTAAFRSFIQDVFSEEFDYGVEKDDLPEYDLFSRLLDLEDPQSAGIFDHEKAKEIERKGYKHQLSILSVKSRLVGIFGPIRAGSFQTPLNMWRGEFVQKYGEEP